MKFIKSTKFLKNLILLTEIEKNLNSTQAQLAELADVSVAMVNNYMNKLRINGYVETYGNNRNAKYKLTPKGNEHKGYLLISFMSELIEISRNMTLQIKQMMLSLVIDCNEKAIFLYGAGETGQVCATIASEIPGLKIIGFIDDDKNIQNTYILGYCVYSLETAISMYFDKIVISVFSSDNPKVKLKKLVDINKVVTFSELDSSIWSKKNSIM